MFGHGSKSETGIVLRLWVKHYELEEFSQLLSCDIEEFTSHGALSSYMEKPNCEKPMLSTPLRQMYKLRQLIRYIYSQVEKDMELDNKDHPLTSQNWKFQSSNTFMKFVSF